MPRPPRQTAQRAPLTKGESQRVWTLREGEAVAVAINVGPTDGRMTEVTGGEVREGMQVITEILSAPQ